MRSFSYRSISELWHWSEVARREVHSAFQSIPKRCSTSRVEQKVFMDLALRAPSHAGTCLSLLVPAKANCNADTTAYRHCIPTAYIQLYTSLWNQFGEAPRIGVKVLVYGRSHTNESNNKQ